MSFFDDASLVLIPSGYKASKVYSVKPTDGTGDLSFTRSLDTATRVGPDGLIEKVRTNLVLQSQTFDNAYWNKLASSVTANATAAPDGTLTAEKLVENSANDFHAVEGGSFTYSAGEHSWSIFAKASERNVLQLLMNGSLNVTAVANFNLTTGVVSLQTNAVASIESVGNGWFRCSMVYAATTATVPIGYYSIQTSPTATRATSYLGDGTSGLFLWGAQMTTGVATPYIPTTTAAVSVGMLANVPRLDYLGGGCPKLLLEPQRTNLQIYSENSGLWQQPADGLTVVYNTTETLDPAGFNGAEKVTFSSGNGRMFEAVANAIGSVTMSAFVKAGTGNTIRLRTTSASIFVDFNLTTQTITSTAGTGTITNYGNGWYRVTATGTSATTPEVAQYVFPNTAGQFVYFYGAQFENGSYATSYIPTLGAAVTRGADAASKTGISSLIGQTEGTLFFEVDKTSRVDNDFRFQISDGTTNNWLFVGVEVGNNIRAYVNVGGVNQFSVYGAAVTSGIHKVAIAYKANDFKVYVDGVAWITQTSGSVPTCSRLDIGAAAPTTQAATDSKTSQALLFKTRLTNAQLAELTA